MSTKLLVVVSTLAVVATSCSSFVLYDGGAESSADAADADIADVQDTSLESGTDATPDVVCAPRRGDCNGMPTDGCETALDTPSNCNACGVTCGAAGTVATSCTSAGCLLTCAWDHADCDGDTANGCERFFDINHCGSCTIACGAGQICCFSVSRVPGDCRTAPNC